MVALSGALIVAGSDALDFEVYRVMAERYPLGTMYESHDWWYQPRYSPVAVVPLSIVAWLGQDVWRLMHFAALIGLPGWTRLVALGTYPFWLDVHAGNVLIVVTVAAYWAVRGNRWGIAATLLLALLIPRPMMLPIVVWVLWKHPAWRWGFAVLFGVHLVAVAATGYASDWIAILLTATEGGSGVGSFLNAAPSAFMGLWWMALAVPAAIWALSRGHPATAGLLLQPYWLPHYFLILLADQWRRLFRGSRTVLGIARREHAFLARSSSGRAVECGRIHRGDLSATLRR